MLIQKLLVARRRFELPSEGPEPSMIDRYTTGLNSLLRYRKVSLLINKFSLPPVLEGKTGFLYVLIPFM